MADERAERFMKGIEEKIGRKLSPDEQERITALAGKMYSGPGVPGCQIRDKRDKRPTSSQ